MTKDSPEVLLDLNRIRILMLLATAKDALSLVDLSASLKLTRAQALIHVKALREAGVLKARKRGQTLYYRFVSEKKWMPSLLKAQTALGVSNKQLAEDLKRFTRRLPKSIKV
jgi:DNA-binding transcriptional ArsR family regulator